MDLKRWKGTGLPPLGKEIDRKTAIEHNYPRYMGRPCKCGSRLRYTKTYHCVSCQRRNGRQLLPLDHSAVDKVMLEKEIATTLREVWDEE